jgi:hypothetical protein
MTLPGFIFHIGSQIDLNSRIASNVAAQLLFQADHVEPVYRRHPSDEPGVRSGGNLLGVPVAEQAH